VDSKVAFERISELTLVDVREQWEWDAGRIEGAVHIPLGELLARLDEVSDQRPILMVCRSGARSGDAAEYLRGLGYDAQNLEGGLKAWAEAGLPFSGMVV
jgi:rhodanese-related sulfurtransferase